MADELEAAKTEETKEEPKKTIGWKAGVAAGWLAGAAMVGGTWISVPKSEMPDKSSSEIVLQQEGATKTNNLFGVGRIPEGQSLSIYLSPSWSDSAKICIIKEPVMFVVKIDTVY